MKSQRVNVRPGQRLEIVYPCVNWCAWQSHAAALRDIGAAMGIEIVLRAADTTGWRGTWRDGRPR